MTRYLIDANLPSKLAVWRGSEFAYVNSINDEWSDAEVWEHARENDLVIVTKDADFSHRIIVSQPPPRIIHIKVGNLRLGEFERFIDTAWPALIELSETHKLVNVFADRIEAVE